MRKQTKLCGLISALGQVKAAFTISTETHSTYLPWFYFKRGIVLILISAFSLSFGITQPYGNLFPAFAGVFIVVASLMAEKVRHWYHLSMQSVTMVTLLSLFWSGAKFIPNVLRHPCDPLPVMADLRVMWIALMSCFIRSSAFQDEFEDAKDASPIVKQEGRL